MSGLATQQLDKQNRGEYENIQQNNLAAMSVIGGVKPPDIELMKVRLQRLVQQGVLTPEMAQTFLQEASAYADIDPRYQEAQTGALEDLQGVVDERGMDPQARAVLHELRGEIQSAERGNREAILQNAAARGISGSGIELAANLANQQGGATALANQGFQSAADANARRMAAIQGVGQLGGQIHGQEENKAQAQNAINQFNAANRQSVENQNTGWRNEAQAQNLAEKQRIADQNVFTRNQQELYNKGLYQQDFSNRMSQAQAYANAAQGASQNNLGIAQTTAGAQNAVTGGMASKWSDENLKTDIQEIDTDEFLSGLTGYKYKYKDPKDGEGEHVSPMAQDIEKIAPQAIIDTPHGKAVNYAKLGGPALAALGALAKRVDELEQKNA
jgi:hypothetical protein